MRKRLISMLLCISFLVVMLVGCSNSNGTSNSAITGKAASAAGKDNHLRLVAGNTSVAHLDSLLSSQAGLYEENGLDVDITNINTGNADIIQALLSNKADVAACGATGVLQYINQGEDLVIIAGQMTNGTSLFVLPERKNEFTELNQETLSGKKIGATRLSTGDIALRTYLYEQGVDLSKIDFVELDSNNTIIESIKKGIIDLAILPMTYRQVGEREGLVVASYLDDLYPNFLCCRLFTTSEKLNANRQAYVDFVKSNIEAYHLIYTDEEKAIKDALKVLDIDEDILKTQLYEYGHLTLNVNPSRLDVERFYNSMVMVGYAENNYVNIDDHIDTSLFEEALGELLKDYPDDKIYQELKKISDETNKI